MKLLITLKFFVKPLNQTNLIVVVVKLMMPVVVKLIMQLVDVKLIMQLVVVKLK